MNKHCYRIIFSRTHGELRVVPDIARSYSTQPGQSQASGVPRLWVTIMRSLWMLSLAMFAAPLFAAGIVADNRAVTSQRPEVINTPNGLPQVNITAPNQAGISHNQYSQFDVNQRGAILNNSAVMTSTQLAGMIQGNPNLNPGKASASVILNEVNSANPSQLHGYMEVAGGRAQVIVANPSGIICNGCGTINAGRMTLTTGKPQLNADGSMAGYQVERGVVRIEGGGLNGDARHDTDYVDILARAVEVNAGVWAKEGVSVVAGRNRLSSNGKTVAPLSDNGSAKPQLAIDMGTMGGMYSGSIRMIGTETGVGVRNQNAQFQAGKTLMVSSEGKLSWQSDAHHAATQAGGDIQLAARDAVNYQGKLHAGGQLSVQSREGRLTQTGTLAAAGDMHLNATRGIVSSGHLLSNKSISAVGDRVDISDAKVSARQATLIAQNGGVALQHSVIDSEQLVINTGGDIDARQAQVKAGRWEVDAHNLFNQHAIWSQTESSESRFKLTGRLDNSDGTIYSRQLSFSAAALANQRGSLLALDNVAQQWRVGGLLDNAGGEMGSNGDLQLDAGSLSNQNGTVKTQASLALNTSGTVNNDAGKLLSGQQFTLSAAGHTSNRAGEISGRVLTVKSDSLDNTQGKVAAQNDVTLKTQQKLNNTGGWIEAGNGLSLNVGGDWDNAGGTAQGGRQVIAAAHTLNNSGGRLQSGGDLSLNTTGDVLNREGKLTAQQTLRVNAGSASLFDNDGGSLQSGGDLSLQGGRLTNRQTGLVFSQNALFLGLVGEWDNQGGTLTGNGSTSVHAAGLRNARGSINSLDSLEMQFTRMLDNGQGRIFSKLSQKLDAPHINNTSGWMGSQSGWHAVTAGFDNTLGSVQSQQNAQLSTSWLGNAKGVLQSAADLVLNVAKDIDNRGGKLQSGGGLSLDAQTLNNSGGAVRSNGNQRVTAGNINNLQGVFSSQGGMDLVTAHLENAGGTLISQGAGNYHISRLNNQQGKVHSNLSLALDARQVNNQGGQLVATLGLSLKADALDNSGKGTLSSQTLLNLQTDRLNNRDGGLILGTTHTGITARDIDNAAGRLQSAGSLSLSALSHLDNRQGRILANGGLGINAGQSPVNSPLTLLNQGGRVESAGDLTLHTRSLENQQGTLLGLQSLSLTAQQDYTHTAGESISSNGTLTFSLNGVFNNLADWLLPGELVLSAAGIANPAKWVGKTLQLTTHGTLQNTGRIKADRIKISAEVLDNTAALIGDDVSVRGRIIDNHGQPAVIAATQSLALQTSERLSNRDGALLYSGDRLSLQSDDLIENRASAIEADGDLTVEARRLNNLREGLELQRDAEKSDYKWHRANLYWRSFGSGLNTDKSTMAPTTQQLTFQNDAALESNRFGTLLAIDALGKRAQVRMKDNQGQPTDLWVNYLALTPNADGTYAMTFYGTRGHRQNNVPTPYQNTFWREYNRGRLEQWDPKRHIDIYSAPNVTDYNNLRERTATGTVTRDALLNEGIGARILAGGNMLLRTTGQIYNDASVITARGNLELDGGGSVNNRGYSVNERRQEFIVDHYDRDTKHWYPTFNHDETTALATIDGIISGNGNVTINGASITNTTVSQAQISRLEAALKAVDAERAEFERNPLAFTLEGADQREGDMALAAGSQLKPPGRPLLPAELALTQMQYVGSVATKLPDNGLFSQHTHPGSPFLVVTDERFTRRDKFISSDYLLDRMGYDPARVHKRLGDGFYEQRMVREQVLALTGKPSVRGEDAMTQYQLLMSNGAKVAQDYHLVPGVALTPEQIAALQQDIVWLVSETVQTAEGPQTVWVPTVYLAQSTLRLTGDGAVIGGGNLKLSGGSITNAGNLFADKALSVDAGQFLHQSGDIKAGSIDVQADTLAMSVNLQDALRQATMSADDISLRGTDVLLAGAKLTATDTLSLSARNDLTITTARSSHTGDLEVISGSMGNRSRGGMEDAGKRMARVSGEWQQALGSTLTSGGDLRLSAAQNLVITGSQVQAGGQLGVQAGGNINIKADTTTNRSHLAASSRTSSVSNSREEERLTLSTLSGNQGVTLVAGNQLRAEGAQVDSKEGRIGLSAQDVTITDARTHTLAQDSESKREGKKRSQREEKTQQESSTGSTFSGQQGVTVIGREGDVTVTGSALHSEQGAIALQAKKDLQLNTASESESHYSEERTQKKSFLRKRSSHTVSNDRITRENGTLLSGESVSVSAGNDLTVKGSAIAADRDVSLQAGHNADIVAATETESHYFLEKKKKSGLMGSGGIGFTIGKQSSKREVDEKGTTQSQSVSTVGSSQGNVSITAGNQLHIGGADLVAARDLNLTGDSVTIDPGYDQRSRAETFEQKQSGLSLALSGSVGSALNTAVSVAQQARKESDSRLSVLQGTKAVLSGAQAVVAYDQDSAITEAAKSDGAAQGATNTVGVSLSYGSQSSSSQSHTQSNQATGSTLNAGSNIAIKATGKNNGAESGDISVAGSQLKAGGDISLDAARDIHLHASKSTEQSESKNSSKGGSVGVGIGVGAGGYGIGVSASINNSKGKQTGNSLTHNEATLDAGNAVHIISGRDTTLKGAQVSGESVRAEIGRNLTLQSEQDSDRYDLKQQSASAGGSFTFGSMTGSVNVNASKDKIRSNFDSVKEQSGLFAGQGGYNINVGNHTQLDGAVISSTAGKDKNLLDTGTLGWSDIHNQADFKSEHKSAGFNSGDTIGANLLSNLSALPISGSGSSGHAEGTTKAAVSEGGLIIRNKEGQSQNLSDLNRDTEQANDGAISPIFNKEKEQKRLQQAQLVSDIAHQSLDIYHTHEATRAKRAATASMSDPQLKADFENKAKAELAQAKALNPEVDTGPGAVNSRAWQLAYDSALRQQGANMGGSVRTGVNAVVNALQALAGGDIKAALAQGAAPYLAAKVKEITTNNAEYSTLTTTQKFNNLMAHAILGGVIAELSGGNAAAGATGAVTGELAVPAIALALYGTTDSGKLSTEQKENLSALATLASGIAAGVGSDSSSGALAGALAGKNAVENNWLSSKEARQLDQEMQDCKASGGDCNKMADKYIQISNQNSKELKEACTGGGVACVTWQELIQGATNVANDANPSQNRLDEKLKDPTAAALVNYLNGTDLKFLEDNITTGDRLMSVVMDPTSWPVVIMGGKAIITNAVNNSKEQLIAVGVSGIANAGIQYGTTGEIKLSDVIGSVIVGGVTAGKGYNQTVTWNTAGGYYQAELKGDDPFFGALLSKGGAATGYAAGNILKVPADKIFNPVSKQYEWVPTGVWTITKPAPQHSLPSILGNAGNAAASGGFTEGMNEALKAKRKGKDE